MKNKEKQIIVFIIFVLTIVTIVSFFEIFKIVKKEDVLYISKTQDNSSYFVNLKDNVYIDNNILNENNSYITQLVENIDVTFNYKHELDKKFNVFYNYQITATVVGSYEEAQKTLLNKKFNLLSKDKIDYNESNNIEERININLETYEGIIKTFIADLNINIDAVLKIKLNINYYGDINKNHYTEIIIPLNKKVFDIVLNKNFNEEERTYLNEQLSKEDIFVKVIINILILSAFYVVNIYLIKRISSKYLSEYTKTVKKILKDYDERIVEVRSFVKYKNWETVDIKSFKELINLSDEAFEPIFFWQKRYSPNKEAWFCILRDKVLYKYVIYGKKK